MKPDPLIGKEKSWHVHDDGLVVQRLVMVENHTTGTVSMSSRDLWVTYGEREIEKVARMIRREK
jgi:hypothetical protein